MNDGPEAINPGAALATNRKAWDGPIDHNVCAECGGCRWVRVKDKPVLVGRHKSEEILELDQWHMAPCRLCLPERYELYSRGHFDAIHVDGGGCAQCVFYLRPWDAKDNPRNKNPVNF